MAVGSFRAAPFSPPPLFFFFGGGGAAWLFLPLPSLGWRLLCGCCVVWLVPRHSWRRFLCATPRHSWLGFAAAGGGRSPPLLAGVRWRWWCVVCGVWRWCVGGVVAGVWCGWSLATPGRGSCVLLPATPGLVSLPLVVGGPRHSWLGSVGGVAVWCVVCGGGVLVGLWLVCGVVGPSPLLAEVPVCYSPPLLAGFRCRWWWAVPATPGWGPLAVVVCGVWCLAVVCWWGCGWCVVWLVPRHSWRRFLCATPRHSCLGFAAAGGGRSPPLLAWVCWRRCCVVCGVWRWCVGGVMAGVWCHWSLATPGGGSCVLLPATPGWVSLPVVVGGPRHSWLGSTCGGGVWCVVCGGGVLVGLWLVCGVVGPLPLLAVVPLCFSPPLLAGFRCRWWWAVPATPGWGPLAAVVCDVWCVVCGVLWWCVVGVAVGVWRVAVVCCWGCGWCVVWLVPRHSWRRFLCATPRQSWLGFAAFGGGWSPPLLAGVRSRRWCVVCGVWCVGGVPRHSWRRFLCATPRHSWLGFAGGGGLWYVVCGVWWWCVVGVVVGVWCGWSPATPGWVLLPVVVGGPRHSWLGSAGGSGVPCVVCGVWRWCVVGVVVGVWCGWSLATPGGGPCVLLPATPGWVSLPVVVGGPRHSWLGSAGGGGVWCVVCGVWRWCVVGVVAAVWCGWSLATPGGGSCVLFPATPGWVSLPLVVGGPRHSWLGFAGGSGVWCVFVCVLCLAGSGGPASRARSGAPHLFLWPLCLPALPGPLRAGVAPLPFAAVAVPRWLSFLASRCLALRALPPRLCLPLGRWLLFGGCSPAPLPFCVSRFSSLLLGALVFLFFFSSSFFFLCAPPLSLVFSGFRPRVPWASPLALFALFAFLFLGSPCACRSFVLSAWLLAAPAWFLPPPPPLCFAVFVPAARCCVPCGAVLPWVRCCAALLRVVSPGVLLSCAVLRSCGAAACCAVPFGAARRPGVLCSAALCFAVFPRAVCSVLCVFCRGAVVRAVVRRSALCCVCLGVLCCAFPVLSVLCGAVLRCAGALVLCCSCRACCCWRLVLWCAAVCCAVSCGVPWCGAGSGGPWLSAGGVFRCRCPCLAAWSASLWLVWFAVVPCFPVSCSVVLCCRVVLCCCALLSCCGAVGACFALLWAVVLCCVVLLVGCAVFGPVVVSACCGALFLVLCVPCLLRSVRCGALLCWLWCPASLCRMLWRCAVVWCCAVVLCCRFAVLFVLALPSCGLSCGASVVCAVVAASCCGVSLCVVVSPWAFCGVVVLLWCVVVSCCAVRCPVVSCALCRVLRCRSALQCCAVCFSFCPVFLW